MNRQNITIKWRLIAVLIAVLFVAFIIELRLYYVQVVKREYYTDRADHQYYGKQSDVFDRGSIYFTSKDGTAIAAATLKVGYKVILNPKLIEFPEDVFNVLSSEIEIDPEIFLYKAEKENDQYEELAKRVSQETADTITEKSLKGVSLFKEKWRFYPGADLAAHTIGFMAYNDQNELKGQYGLERQYESVLDRTSENLFTNFFVEIFSNIKDAVAKPTDAKGSLHLTIEPVVQQFLETEIAVLIKKYGGKNVGGIIMDPKTGEITAMALVPNFDINTFNMVSDASVYQNDLVESVYEMGSIIKPITMAIGLDQGKVTAHTTYDDKGSVTLNGFTFYNHDKKAHGITTMQQVLNNSWNIGAANVAARVGNDVFGDYMRRLFGEKSGIDLPNETASLIANLTGGRDIEYATASFGQGIALSPIAVTTALASLGNGGLLVTPHLVREIEYQSGFSKKVDFPEPRRIFKKETSEEISRMLTEVVDTALRGGRVAMPNYSIAAKTGTAQIANKSARGYYDDRFLHSFFGYFPAFDPQFIVFLYIIEPQTDAFASDTLTDSFMNITKYLINYYEIPPDREAKKAKQP